MTDDTGSRGTPGGEPGFARLDRFLAGECSPAEAEEVRRWLAADPDARRYADAVRDALARGGGVAPATAGETDQAWARLARDTVDAERNQDRLRPALTLTTPAAERGRLSHVARSVWLRAAVVLLVLGGGAWWAIRGPRAPLGPATGPASPVREYVTARGQRTELRLPDGTRVMLAPETRLGVPADFAASGTASRGELTLRGEAYFEVTHDARRPLRVRAGDAVVSDLGTRFVVRAEPRSRAVQVVVAEGKVQLGAVGAPSGTGPVLVRGDLARLDSAGVVATARANLDTALAWTRGELAFHDAPLGRVAAELGRWYDLDIRVADSALARERLTLTVSTESVPQALDGVALLVNARYEVRGQRVLFSRRDQKH